MNLLHILKSKSKNPHSEIIEYEIADEPQKYLQTVSPVANVTIYNAKRPNATRRCLSDINDMPNNFTLINGKMGIAIHSINKLKAHFISIKQPYIVVPIANTKVLAKATLGSQTIIQPELDSCWQPYGE